VELRSVHPPRSRPSCPAATARSASPPTALWPTSAWPSPRDRQGDTWTDGETSFFRITCWRQLAENVTETLGKGARAIVIGRLRVRSWETDQGERRSLVEVEADEVGPSLKFATATIQRTNTKAAASASKGGQFNHEPPF
jgi:single-strand DNA-binding protein